MTIKERFSGYTEGFKQRKWMRRISILIVVVLVAAGAMWLVVNGEREEALEVVEVLPRVEVKTFEELVGGGLIEKVAIVEPVTHAPLIARTGGRVTDIKAWLGATVQDGQVVVEIDGGNEPNMAEMQLATASAALGTFNNIERLALESVNNGVAAAELGLESAAAGQEMSEAQVQKSRQQADLSVRQTELAWQDQVEAETRNDALVRAADIAFKAAGLAQDQATLALRRTNQQTGDAIKQAEKGLVAAKLTRDKLVFDLQSQRLSIQGQAAAARESVKMAQVIAPMAGQVTRLSVRIGDFIRPGEIVGEVLAFAGAQVTLDVSAGMRNKLEIGREVEMEAESQSFMGEIVRLASGPSAETALWQVDILITGTPEIIHPGDLVTVKLPVGEQSLKTAFIPLDAVTVRQDGMVLFTVGEDNVVVEHEVEVVGFTGDFVEGVLDDIDLEARVVVEGNRTLQAGETVEIIL